VSSDKSMPPLPRPYLRTADRFTVNNLKQYLVLKFPQFTADNVRDAPVCCVGVCPVTWAGWVRVQIEISCEGHPLVGREHTISFLYKTTWRDKDSEMILQYALS
jgi:hypothetical protein